jgi:hypothetical protein
MITNRKIKGRLITRMDMLARAYVHHICMRLAGEASRRIPLP